MSENERHWAETYRSLILPRDLDHLEHLNIARYFEAVTSAGMDMIGRVGLEGEAVAKRRLGLVVLHMETDFIREVHAGEVVFIKSSISRIGNKSLEALHNLYVTGRDELAMTCSVTTAMMDLNARKTVPIPDDIREKIITLFNPEIKS